MSKKWVVFPEAGWYSRGMSGHNYYWDGETWSDPISDEEYYAKHSGHLQHTHKHISKEEYIYDEEHGFEIAVREQVVKPVVIGTSAFLAITTAVIAWRFNRKK